MEANEEWDLHDERFRMKPRQQMASTCASALLASFFVVPLDVIKTRLQSQQRPIIETKPYNGMLDAVVKIVRQEGIKSLWSGLGPTICLTVPATVIYLSCYENLRLNFKDIYIRTFSGKHEQHFLSPMLAGMISRTLAVSIVSPLELIKTKLQSQQLDYKQLDAALRNLISTNGLSGLWNGLKPTLLRDVPFSAIYWGSYESIKGHLSANAAPDVTVAIVSGAAAATIATVVTHPFDMAKTHRQIEFGEDISIGSGTATNQTTTKRLTTIHIIRSVFQRNGLSGVFAGLLPRLIKLAPACAILIGTFEYGRIYFYQRNVTAYQRAASMHTTHNENNSI